MEQNQLLKYFTSATRWLLARNKNWLHSFMNSTNCLFAAANIKIIRITWLIDLLIEHIYCYNNPEIKQT